MQLNFYSLFILIFFGLFLTKSNNLFAQSGDCSIKTPFLEVDLSDNAEETYISPSITRRGRCCGSLPQLPPDQCVEFEVTVHPDAVGLILDIYSGPIPAGNLTYDIDCGNTTVLGQPFCVESGGTFTITFCAPGSSSDQNEFSIQSIRGDLQVEDKKVKAGCVAELSVTGDIYDDLVWREVTSGTGMYDAYLSCTQTCTNPEILVPANGPSVIQYEVCAKVSPIYCDDFYPTVCDTATVEVEAAIEIGGIPDTVYFCQSVGYVNVTASVEPKSFYYQYSFDDAPFSSNNSTLITTTGTHSVIVKDGFWGDCARDTLYFEV